MSSLSIKSRNTKSAAPKKGSAQSKTASRRKVTSGGAILVRRDGFIGFRAAPADETTMDALDAHLTTYLVPGSHQAV